MHLDAINEHIAAASTAPDPLHAVASYADTLRAYAFARLSAVDLGLALGPVGRMLRFELSSHGYRLFFEAQL
jgi:hypothetical protein